MLETSFQHSFQWETFSYARFYFLARDEAFVESHEWTAKLKSRIIFLNRPSKPPYSLDPLKNTNFANFGPIWIKLGVKVKNGEENSNPEFIF